MKLDGILLGNQALLYMERYVDEGTRTYSPFSAKESAVRGRVAEAFHRNFPDAEIFFPGDTTY